MCQSMEGQEELLTDVHGTHIHEADPWGCEAVVMTVLSSHVRNAVRVVVVQKLSDWEKVSSDGKVGEFHGGSLALNNELGVHVWH